jgi:hypothetical protein
MERTLQLVKFTLYQMPCCGQLLCWVNPRRPNHCPECGTAVPGIRDHVRYYDGNATLTLGEE